MNALITGGAGFIGSQLSRLLLEKGIQVTVLDDLSTGIRKNLPADVHFINRGIESPECERVFKNGRFDLVFHLAAQISVQRSMENPYQDVITNVSGLVNMLDFAKKAEVPKFIFASSAAVYGDKTLLPISEEESLDPKSPYGISKSIGELYCKKWTELFGLETLILRFSNVYGPRQSGSLEGCVIPNFIGRALSGLPIFIDGDGEQTRDFLFVEDLSEGILKGALSDKTGVYNLSSGSRCSINQLVRQLEVFLPPFRIEHRAERKGDIRHSLLENKKAIRDFDWKVSNSLGEGLKKTCEWCGRELESMV